MTMLMGEETIICLACRSEDPTHYLWHFGAGLNSTLGGSLLKSGPGFLYHEKDKARLQMAIGPEASAGAHFLGSALRAQGHQVRLSRRSLS
jgi:hypothetical protein